MKIDVCEKDNKYFVNIGSTTIAEFDKEEEANSLRAVIETLGRISVGIDQEANDDFVVWIGDFPAKVFSDFRSAKDFEELIERSFMEYEKSQEKLLNVQYKKKMKTEIYEKDNKYFIDIGKNVIAEFGNEEDAAFFRSLISWARSCNLNIDPQENGEPFIIHFTREGSTDDVKVGEN